MRYCIISFLNIERQNIELKNLELQISSAALSFHHFVVPLPPGGRQGERDSAFYRQTYFLCLTSVVLLYFFVSLSFSPTTFCQQNIDLSKLFDGPNRPSFRLISSSRPRSPGRHLQRHHAHRGAVSETEQARQPIHQNNRVMDLSTTLYCYSVKRIASTENYSYSLLYLVSLSYFAFAVASA